MRTIAIINRKGGVAKTTTAINLAHILAEECHRKVVLVDCDGQMDTTRSYLPEFDPAIQLTTADVIAGTAEPLWEDNVIPISANLSVLGSSGSLYEMDLAALKDGMRNANALLDFADAAREDGETDYMIFDCPAGFTAASVAALMAADDVVIPVTLDGYAVSGVDEMVEQINSLQRARAHIHIAGVLLTQTRNTDVVWSAAGLLRTRGVPVFRTAIRRTEKVPESTFYRQPVTVYSRTSAAARDYRTWVEEYLQEVPHEQV